MIRWSYVSIMSLSLASHFLYILCTSKFMSYLFLLWCVKICKWRRLYSIRYLCCRSVVFLVLLCFIL